MATILKRYKQFFPLSNPTREFEPQQPVCKISLQNPMMASYRKETVTDYNGSTNHISLETCTRLHFMIQVNKNLCNLLLGSKTAQCKNTFPN